MHLLAISLLTILAGTLLLAKFRKDMPGKFFVFISWFFIIAGFVLFVGAIGGGICRMTHHGCIGQTGCQHEMMMKDCGHGMQGAGCCSQGMGMQGGGCCMKGMGKGMCARMPGCMSHDSTMKCCGNHMDRDTTKMMGSK
jgi:hypothetical protein